MKNQAFGGLHIHIDAANHSAKTLKNLVNIYHLQQVPRLKPPLGILQGHGNTAWRHAA